jgi:MFS family permease
MSIPLALDALNFLSADVRNLFGPFINVFLVTSQHWTQTEVGLVTTGISLIGIALQTPIGAVIDVTRAKRAVIVATMAAMSLAAFIIVVRPTFWPMAFAASILAVAGDAFVPAVSALTLGLVTKDAFARRLGRNSAFDHGGNIATALVAGGVSNLYSQRVVFLLVPFYAALTSAAVLSIPAPAIDHDRARDLDKDGDDDGAASGYSALFRRPPLLIFAASALFFHFANAPLLPLVVRKLALQFPHEATAMMSFCMVAAQGVMVPIALLVGWRADQWGCRPIFLIAFSVLPIRAALYQVSDNAFWLLGVQLLDGRRRGNLPGADAARDRRHHARHGPVQPRAGGDRDDARDRGRHQRPLRRRGRRPFRLSDGLLRPRRRGRRRVGDVLPVHAGNPRRRSNCAQRRERHS